MVSPRGTRFVRRRRDVRQGPDGLLYVVTEEDDAALLRLILLSKTVKGSDPFTVFQSTRYEVRAGALYGTGATVARISSCA